MQTLSYQLKSKHENTSKTSVSFITLYRPDLYQGDISVSVDSLRNTTCKNQFAHGDRNIDSFDDSIIETYVMFLRSC